MVTIDRDHLNRRKTVATTTKKVADQGQMGLSFVLLVCRVFASSSLMLEFPAWNCSMLDDRDEANAPFATLVQDDLDNAWHSCDQNQDARQWKHLCLEFGSDHSLSSKVINKEAGDDEELEFAIIPVEAKHPKLPAPVQTCHGAFEVARTDLKARKKGKVQKKDLKSKGASLLAGISKGVTGMSV